MITIRYRAVTCVLFLLHVMPSNLMAQEDLPDTSPRVYTRGSVVVLFREDVSIAGSVQTLSELGLKESETEVTSRMRAFNLPLNEEKRIVTNQGLDEWISRLKQLPFIEIVEPNYHWTRPLSWSPNDDNFQLPNPGDPEGQWSLYDSEPYSINAESAWDISRGAGTKIAIIDMGFPVVNGVTIHEDLQLSSQAWDAVDHSEWTIENWEAMCVEERWLEREGFREDGGGEPIPYKIRGIRRPIGDFRGQDSELEWKHVHGGIVAGVAGALTDNEDGIAGVAPDAEIIPIRVGATYINVIQTDINYPYGEGPEVPAWKDSLICYPKELGFEEDFSYYDLCEAIYWAINTAHVDVINMSFTLGSLEYQEYQILDASLGIAANNGVIIVAGSGNSGIGSAPWPARSTFAIAVGASEINGDVWNDSSYMTTMDFPDIVAPGVDVWGTVPFNALGSDSAWVMYYGDAEFWGNEWRWAPDPPHSYLWFDDEHVGVPRFMNEFSNYDYEYIDGIAGTSLSSPHVAGCAALIKSYIPDLMVFQVRALLEDTAIETNHPERDGEGLVDIATALSELKIPDLSLVVDDDMAKPTKSQRPPSKSVIVTWGEYSSVLPFKTYRLFRRTGGSWPPIDELTPASEYFLYEIGAEGARWYRDNDVEPQTTYHYLVLAWDEDWYYPEKRGVEWWVYFDGYVGRSDSKSIYVPGDRPPRPDPSAAQEAPDELVLDPNYPNPFNPNTQIKFGLPTATHVRLQIMNIRGQIVRVLVDEDKPAGWYTVTWDGKNESGRDVASGIYLYLIEVDNKTILKKMTLIR